MANHPEQRRSRPNRSRQGSSLSAMMMMQEETKEQETSASPRILLAPTEEELLLIARRLRRAKRSLLLKSVEAPASPVDKFRSIVMNLSQQEARNLPSLPYNTIKPSTKAA